MRLVDIGRPSSGNGLASWTHRAPEDTFSGDFPDLSRSIEHNLMIGSLWYKERGIGGV